MKLDVNMNADRRLDHHRCPKGPRLCLRLTAGLVLAVGLTVFGSPTALGGLVPAHAATANAAPGTLNLQLEWSTGSLGDAGGAIAESSPTVATLDGGGPAVVVGDRAGRVYALHLSNGTEVPGWPVSLHVPVDSTPSAAVIGAGGLDSVFVGSGNADYPSQGGYQAIAPAGNVLWHSEVVEQSTDAQVAHGVQASLSVGPLAGRGLGVVAGSLDEEEYALDANNGATLPGWPFFTSDSVFSTAALADLYGTGRTEIVEGSDQTAGFADGQIYPQGGHLRILNGQGGLICHYDTNQTMDSSPAVGGFLGGGRTGIVLGTGSYFAGASDTDKVMAFNSNCGLQWSTGLDGSTFSSPALADVAGDGSMDVVEGTATPSGGGSVWVLDGATGAPLWHAPATGAVIGSVTTADLTGDGYQDILVPTTLGVDIFDGRSHQQVAVLNGTADPQNGVLGVQNSPLVTDDPNGTIGITVAGYGCPTSQCFGQVEHYEIPGSNGALAVGSGSWPEFHHDPQLTGNAGGTPAPGSVPACTIPSAAFSGYRLAASDGGIFAFGAPFCGSMGGIRLNEPVVGMALDANTGGYWLVASDGGVFAFGAARFYGSMGGIRLNKPIVGMAATPDGKGYWLVASDGGVFAFGDAAFKGSRGGQKQAPVIGMAVTADGNGYRLVSSDGSVFTFGDAQYFGSMGGRSLASPIVGTAVDVATGGYWLVASDGGVFAFNAPFYGSMGGHYLEAPVTGIAPTSNGSGYRLVAADGGIFSFGNAPFYGSMGNTRLNGPIVGAAGF